VRPLLASALISLVAGTTLVSAQRGRDEPQLRVAVDVDLVVFNVTVTDGKGRAISGLQATDFRITEEGRDQMVAFFDAADVPASIGLIVDNSGSMADKRAEVIDAALAFVAASNPRDEMFVVNFNEHAYMGLPVPFTSDARQIHAALLQRPPTGLTALYDALALGIDHLKAGTRDRKALVVLSDGGDNASRRSLDEVLLNARQSNATIYTIGIYDEVDRDKDPRTLRKIAGLSGGRAYFPRALEDLDHVWRDIAGGIRSQYTLAYHSSNATRDGAFRNVRITAGRNGKRDLRVAARDGYFAPAGGPR
jgi:Ca-activated chloride channel family protein